MTRVALILTASAVATLICTPLGAEARERRTQADITTPRGSAVAERSVASAPGARSAATTLTGAGGRTSSVTQNQTWDRSAGTAASARTQTFNDGSTRSVSSSAVRTAPGQFDVERTLATRAGEVRIQTGDLTLTQEPDGRLVAGEMTGPGGTSSYTASVKREEGTRSRQAQTVFPDGTTRSLSEAATRTGPGVYEADRTLTTRSGETRSGQAVIAITPGSP